MKKDNKPNNVLGKKPYIQKALYLMIKPGIMWFFCLVCLIGLLVFSQSAAAETDEAAEVEAEEQEAADENGPAIHPIEFFNEHDDLELRFRYNEYLQSHVGQPKPVTEYSIEASDYIAESSSVTETLTDFEGNPGLSVQTEEYGTIEWEVNITEPGLYNIAIEYFNIPGRNSDIQRTVYINGELPFFEAGLIEFSRVWINESDVFQTDNAGNQIRPGQVEKHTWQTAAINNPANGYSEPLFFFLHAGANRITLTSVREPMVIRSLRVYQAPTAPAYASLSRAGQQPATGETIVIRGQYANRKSSPMLFPMTDRSSPAPDPHSSRHVMLNNIGGEMWSIPGQWIEWDFYVPAAGLYNIAMSVKQNIIQDTHVYRNITINGENPFKEMEAVPFAYSNTWRVDILGDDEPYLFYLEQGHNTIRMEVTLGDFAPYLRDIQDEVLSLNNIYRRIIMITGATPDLYRDYQIAMRLPWLRDELINHRDSMDRLYDGLTVISDRNVQRDAVMRTASTQFQRIIDRVEDTPRELSGLQNSIGALGTWMMLIRNQPLAVDNIFILPAGEAPPRLNNGFFAALWHELVSLVLSFFIDYSAVGNVVDAGDAQNITVWIGTTGVMQPGALNVAQAGRDQANAVRALIDDSFTPATGINVDLMLVDMAMLLPATLSGQGPDVSLLVGADVPMNYGLRGAVADLSQFNDFEEVVARFHPESMVPYRFREYAFGLPVIQTFPMLFYRSDVLEELELDVPDTWNDVLNALSVLNENNMTFGIPVGDLGAASMAFAMMLYQAGGEFYGYDGRYSALDSPLSLNVFRDFTRLFTDYGLPQAFDGINRFRTGEMPLLVMDFSIYNILQVFAPEIHGLWGFRKVPGTIGPDGTVNYATIAGGSATVMLELSENKDAAWEFMKWWTSADVQSTFGNKLEALLGPAARYPTANEEAFMRMPWALQDFNALLEQYEHIVSIPQVPGGYFTGRQIFNAFYAVVTDGRSNPREALRDNVRYINDEIDFKRLEFGID